MSDPGRELRNLTSPAFISNGDNGIRSWVSSVLAEPGGLRFSIVAIRTDPASVDELLDSPVSAELRMVNEDGYSTNIQVGWGGHGSPDRYVAEFNVLRSWIDAAGAGRLVLRAGDTTGGSIELDLAR